MPDQCISMLNQLYDDFTKISSTRWRYFLPEQFQTPPGKNEIELFKNNLAAFAVKNRWFFQRWFLNWLFPSMGTPEGNSLLSSWNNLTNLTPTMWMTQEQKISVIHELASSVNPGTLAETLIRANTLNLLTNNLADGFSLHYLMVVKRDSSLGPNEVIAALKTILKLENPPTRNLLRFMIQIEEKHVVENLPLIIKTICDSAKPHDFCLVASRAQDFNLLTGDMALDNLELIKETIKNRGHDFYSIHDLLLLLESSNLLSKDNFLKVLKYNRFFIPKECVIWEEKVCKKLSLNQFNIIFSVIGSFNNQALDKNIHSAIQRQFAKLILYKNIVTKARGLKEKDKEHNAKKCDCFFQLEPVLEEETTSSEAELKS